ncbi:MAG: PAC2 family protein [Candidatus Woesearchaeota archaeon]
MQIDLYKRPKNVLIIEGFPGFGLVATIATEFLIDHLETELIGKIWISEMPAIAAIHQSKVVQPLSIHYNKKYNIVLIYGITATQGIEWKLADALLQIANELSAREILCLEGIGAASQEQTEEKPKVFYYSNQSKIGDKLKALDTEALNEGIIMGVTGAMLIRNEKIPFSCVFAETASNMPDSRAAARVLEIVNHYLDLKIDTGPLLKQAEKFESKLKGIMQSSKKMTEDQKKKTLSYMG